MAFTMFPTAPSINSPSTFPSRVDAFVAAWIKFVAEFNQSFFIASPVVKSFGPTDSVQDNETYIICRYTGGSLTLILPSPSTNVGRRLHLKQVGGGGTVVSASANVSQQASGVVNTNILPVTNGAWCRMISDGTNWVIMAKG